MISQPTPSHITISVASAMVQLTDQDILLALTLFEDSFVERKTVNDVGDCLKTAVGFANSAPIGYPAIIFVGVRDNGELEGTIADLDKLQRKLSRTLNEAYPPIYRTTRVLSKDGKQFLAVIIPGSADRPHFAGQAYIRTGSETVAASEEQFARLIAERNSKAREILRWSSKAVTFCFPRGGKILVGNRLYSGRGAPCRVIDCNQFFVTLEFGADEEKEQRAYPLAFIEISYDCENQRLELVGLEY